MAGQKDVLVIGGGVAGMTAAHELAERGFVVTVIEASDDVGGRARSRDVEGLPTEHGFHFLPWFYRHLPDTMARIPAAGLILAREGKHELPFNLSIRSLKDVVGLAKSFSSLGLSAPEMALAAAKLAQLIALVSTGQDEELEKVTWWDFMEADGQSAQYQEYVCNVAVR
jgi:uncharacterized protein with NAD-binding domain and iron-sulfur cluster